MIGTHARLNRSLRSLMVAKSQPRIPHCRSYQICRPFFQLGVGSRSVSGEDMGQGALFASDHVRIDTSDGEGERCQQRHV